MTGQLTYSLENEDIETMTVNGSVTTAELSGIDLFPSFPGWYRNNIYLIPASLITIITGAIALLKMTKKQPND